MKTMLEFACIWLQLNQIFYIHSTYSISRQVGQLLENLWLKHWEACRDDQVTIKCLQTNFSLDFTLHREPVLNLDYTAGVNESYTSSSPCRLLHRIHLCSSISALSKEIPHYTAEHYWVLINWLLTWLVCFIFCGTNI